MSEELLPNIEMKESSLPGFKKMIDYEMIGIKKPFVFYKKTSCIFYIIINQKWILSELCKKTLLNLK